MADFFSKIGQNSSEKFLISILIIGVTFVLFYIVRRIVHNGRVNGQDVRGAKRVVSLTSGLVKLVVFLAVVLAILQINGVNVTSLVAGLGIVSAIVGLALQDFLRDIIMGIQLVTGDFFEVGDVVRFEEADEDEKEGIVISFNLRSTKIRSTYNYNVITLCNRNITKVTRMSDLNMIDVPMSCYEDPIKIHHVLRSICERICKIPGVDKCEYRGTQRFDVSQSAIYYKIFFYCNPENKWQLYREAMMQVEYGLELEGMSIPNLQIDVNMRQFGEALSGIDEYRKLQENVSSEIEERRKTMGKSDRISYRKGDVVFQEGKYESWMFEIKYGSVGIYTAYGTSDEKLLTTMHTDDFVGELGLIYAAPRSATAVAMENETELLKITNETFTEYFQESPKKVMGIMQQMARRLRDLTEDYKEACRTISEMEDSERLGTEKSSSLKERINKFKDMYKFLD